MTALNKQAHQTENECMAQSVAERNGEPVEGLRQRISELEEIATDYGMKFQKAQDALKHQALLHKSQLEAAENNLIDSECHVAELEEALRDKQALLEAAENRITELEARKFKVEMPESFYPDGDIDAPLVVDELEVIAAIVEAGGKPVAFCKRCDREIDLTHRPDGSHYCHAPVAGIGVKGE